MRCKIISPTCLVFEGEVQRVELPSVQGRMVVLSHHAPLLAVLQGGKVVAGNSDSFGGWVLTLSETEAAILNAPQIKDFFFSVFNIVFVPNILIVR